MFELGALVLQSIFGDYKNDREAIKGIKIQNILPKRFFSSLNQINLQYRIKFYFLFKSSDFFNLICIIKVNKRWLVFIKNVATWAEANVLLSKYTWIRFLIIKIHILNNKLLLIKQLFIHNRKIEQLRCALLWS